MCSCRNQLLCESSQIWGKIPLAQENNKSKKRAKREKTKNGSLGEILVNNSYGLLYDLEIFKNKKNINVTRNFSLGYGTSNHLQE